MAAGCWGRRQRADRGQLSSSWSQQPGGTSMLHARPSLPPGAAASHGEGLERRAHGHNSSLAARRRQRPATGCRPPSPSADCRRQPARPAGGRCLPACRSRRQRRPRRGRHQEDPVFWCAFALQLLAAAAAGRWRCSCDAAAAGDSVLGGRSQSGRRNFSAAWTRGHFQHAMPQPAAAVAGGRESKRVCVARPRCPCPCRSRRGG